MKTSLRHGICLSFILALFCLQTAGAADSPPAGFRLTVELRDGSRVIGKSQEDHLKFHSEVLGDLKLPLKKIRNVEALTETNQVKVTTSNGDLLTAEFATKEIGVETVYGDVTLPVAMIKQLRVSTLGGIGRPKDGLIGLWSGEGNGVDSVGGNDGNLVNVSFTDGVVGQAFSFAPDSFPRGTYGGVQIPDKPEFALQSLTIEGWVRPRGNGYVIMSRGDHRPGLDPYTLSMQASHELHFQICDEENHAAIVATTLVYGQWTHVAATLDGDTGTMSLYTNGVLAAQTVTQIKPIGALLPDLSPGLGIGNLNDGGNDFPFIGDLDEIALYNRALSADEINAIYSENAANAGGRAELLPPRWSQGPGMPLRSRF